MRAMLIAIGNSLRGDDGAAHRVLERLGASPGIAMRDLMQLTPELAAEMAAFDEVLFLDADASPGEPRIEALAADAGNSPLAHVLSPGTIVRLAERLCGFRGSAFLCHIPGAGFGIGEGLSAVAEANVAAAAGLVAAWLRRKDQGSVELRQVPPAA